MLLSLRTHLSSCPPWNIFICSLSSLCIILWSIDYFYFLSDSNSKWRKYCSTTSSHKPEWSTNNSILASDSNPPLPNSHCTDPSSSLPSPNSSHTWPIAYRQGKRFTHNPYPFYNFLSYHHLSPLYFSYSFSLSK